MFGYLVLLFTVLPALELIVLIEVGSVIGSVNTILVIILTGVAGAYLARYQGFKVINEIQQNLNQGAMPSNQLMEGLMILVGGIVLLTPGFITDTVGFLLLIPFTRKLIKLFVQKQFEASIRRGTMTTHYSSNQPKNGDYDDIDVN